MGDQNAADREGDGADGANRAEAAAARGANPPPPPPARNGGRRRRTALPILDLDALKQERVDLKRQLRQCTKNVKAQARMSNCVLLFELA